MSERGAGPEPSARVGVAVPAAGSGERMGGVRKPFLELAGEPLLAHALRPFLADPRVVRVAVALAADDASAPAPWLEALAPRVVVVQGGRTRTQSVRAALAALPPDLDVIAVHDAARPLVTPEIVGRCIDLALEGAGAVAGCPAIDTVKRVDDSGTVVETPDRARLWLAQTPQAFPARSLRNAYARPGGGGHGRLGAGRACRRGRGRDHGRRRAVQPQGHAPGRRSRGGGDPARPGLGMSDGPVRIDLRADPDADLSGAVEHLRAGGLIAYPTETVYGLGGVAREPAVSRVRALKGRESGKPLIVLVGSARAAAELRWTPEAEELARIFWPGAVTLVLEDPRGIFPVGVRDERTRTVGVRVSPHPLVRRLMAELRAPLISTSLNAAGEPPARSADEAVEVLRRLDGDDVLVLDGGTLPPSGPSTVVDCSGPEPVVIREGSVPTARLRCALPEIHGEQSS